MKPKRIAIIGNGGGGKTTLSRRLNQLHGLPLTHVDSIQFTAGMLARDREVVAAVLDELALRSTLKFVQNCDPVESVRHQNPDRLAQSFRRGYFRGVIFLP
jgi:ATP-dependent protease HslVU (ClpYQ) ATPase subunit